MREPIRAHTEERHVIYIAPEQMGPDVVRRCPVEAKEILSFVVEDKAHLPRPCGLHQRRPSLVVFRAQAARAAPAAARGA